MHPQIVERETIASKPGGKTISYRGMERGKTRLKHKIKKRRGGVETIQLQKHLLLGRVVFVAIRAYNIRELVGVYPVLHTHKYQSILPSIHNNYINFFCKVCNNLIDLVLI